MAPPVDPRLLRASRAARRQLATAAALAVAAAVLIVAQAVLLADVIASVFIDGATLHDVRWELVALVGAVAGRAAVAAGFELAGRAGAARVMSELRERLAEHLLVKRPLRPAERTGELATTAVQGVDALEGYLAGYVPQLALAATVPLAVLGWVGLHDWVAALLLAISVPLLIVFMILIGRSAQTATEARFGALSLLGAHFLDVVRGLETLRAHNRDRAQEATIAAAGERYRVETMATLRVAFLSALVLELMAMIGTALVAAAVGVQLVEGVLTLQVGLAVLLLAPELFAPLREVGRQFHAGADGLAAAERIFAVLEEPAPASTQEMPMVSVIPSSSFPMPDPGREPIRFEQVGFAHPGRERKVLDGFDLTLQPGELTALVGTSGAGKSTAAALLLRLIEPTAGRVSCGDADLRTVGLDGWRRQLAWVPQRARIFAGTVADNVRLADPGASDREVRRALAAAGAARFTTALPEGIETRVGDGGRPLSAGESQRIALARAFLRDAPLLVLDEPTAHLDAETAAAVESAIVRLAAGRTTLLIAHRPTLAARADRVVTLAAGCVVRDARSITGLLDLQSTAAAVASPFGFRAGRVRHG
ncbi:thiol reductant ABC exporter subunit CydD [Conexibacter sp. JD483]|uniref:thiol reductant ABC exporter subunit CydD n=1 Tax=unclassified Conexibacter TaxID=2627773 RepID=UPI0027241195|nr:MULTISPECIES: thiol reductant ABC exporter subunit CydD [unclassified Conexibacter]MDO8186954.1 thiol reductant ABC exporter subunit CydD [Conexibacter sp. CPCC 205706]MDO8200591.1 thiol reductant ABC exporter subunit CydD [Conexibacter sp. CPCC 205762]MDR9368831.1 thiol reductant ABC exporter subunit CydD [Conexibacter sp. JD483]